MTPPCEIGTVLIPVLPEVRKHVEVTEPEEAVSWVWTEPGRLQSSFQALPYRDRCDSLFMWVNLERVLLHLYLERLHFSEGLLGRYYGSGVSQMQHSPLVPEFSGSNQNFWEWRPGICISQKLPRRFWGRHRPNWALGVSLTQYLCWRHFLGVS